MSWRSKLDLTLHPEGGAFREIFRSEAKVLHPAHGKERSALTHIHFHLNEREASLFHKVASDEIWNLYDGEELILYLWEEDSPEIVQCKLGKKHGQFCAVIPRGSWQAAYCPQGEALIGCSVGPGFDFEDFALLDPKSDTANKILTLDPTLAHLIPSASCS